MWSKQICKKITFWFLKTILKSPVSLHHPVHYSLRSESKIDCVSTKKNFTITFSTSNLRDHVIIRIWCLPDISTVHNEH